MASRPWEQPDRYLRVLDSLARFYNSEKTVHAGYLITSFIAVMAFLSAALSIIMSPTLGNIPLWWRMVAMFFVIATTLLLYFCLNKPWPILFRYLLGRMQLYFCLSNIVWEHMGLNTSGDYADRLRGRTADPNLNGIEDSVGTYFAARLYISICNQEWKHLEMDAIEEDFGAEGLLRSLWPYESRFLRWKLTDVLVLAYRQTLQGYEKGSELHRRIFHRFAELGVVKETTYVTLQTIAPRIINSSGTRTMILIGGDHIEDPDVDVHPLDEHRDYTEFLNKAAGKGWRIVPVQGKKTLVDFYNDISCFAKGTHDKQKPVLIGHSAGAVVALNYLKDRPRESYFDKAILFNCPLVYKWADKPSLRSCYKGTERVTTDSQLIMSENDPLMAWSLDGVNMRKAIDIVEGAGKVKVQRLDRVDKQGNKYEHSPFDPIDVAWEIVNQLPVTVSKRQPLKSVPSVPS
jgi:hypothetical protein